MEIILLLRSKSMNRPSRLKNKHNYISVNSATTTRNSEAEELKNIMSSIKYLQRRVTNLPNFSNKTPLKICPATPKQKQNKYKCSTTSARKHPSSNKDSSKQSHPRKPKHSKMTIHQKSKMLVCPKGRASYEED